jgi:4-oxalocrotonate tautomerase family enzyme
MAIIFYHAAASTASSGGFMPLAQVLTLEQRREMVRGITGVMVQVERLPPSALPYVTVLITEVADGGWGVAGHGYAKEEFPELITKGARTDPEAPYNGRPR